MDTGSDKNGPRVQIKWTQGPNKMDPVPNKMDPDPNKMVPEKMDPEEKWTQVQMKWIPRSKYSEGNGP